MVKITPHAATNFVFSWLHELFFPKRCMWCNYPWAYLCIACTRELKTHPEICPRCHHLSPDFVLCVSCAQKDFPLQGVLINFQYTDQIRKCLTQLKYHHSYDLAPFLAQKLALIILAHQELSQAMYSQTLLISYVPSHWIRKHWIKWYNQSQLLAKHVAKTLACPRAKLTKRNRRTPSQVKLTRQKRLHNLTRAFTRVGKKIDKETKIILLIDDITTTGSTLIHVASCIKKQHPDLSIRGAVVARHN